MLVCLRNNKRTESNTRHPALVGKSRQAVRASSGNPGKPGPKQKKIGYANAYEISFSVKSFFVFITNTVLESIKPPRSVSFNMQRIQVLWNHIAVLIALLTHRALTVIDPVEISSHLPVKMKPFLCLLIQMDFHAGKIITNNLK